MRSGACGSGVVAVREYDGVSMRAIPTEPDTLRTARTLREHFQALWERRETVRYLTLSQLKAGHRDKVLGNLWNILDPLMFMLVYFFVFGVLFGLAGSGGGRSVEFMLYILVGVLLFRFVDGTLTQASNCIRANRGLIHEIQFPKSVFPVAVTFARLYDLLWGLAVLIVILLLAGVMPSVQWLWLPVLLVFTIAFALGGALIIARLGAFFADTTNVVAVVMRLLFYCSPIFYFVRQRGEVPAEQVFFSSHPEWLQVYLLNPLACMFELYRDALLWGVTPDLGMALYLAVVAVVVGVVGFAVFTQAEGRYAKYV